MHDRAQNFCRTKQTEQILALCMWPPQRFSRSHAPQGVNILELDICFDSNTRTIAVYRHLRHSVQSFLGSWTKMVSSIPLNLPMDRVKKLIICVSAELCKQWKGMETTQLQNKHKTWSNYLCGKYQQRSRGTKISCGCKENPRMVSKESRARDCSASKAKEKTAGRWENGSFNGVWGKSAQVDPRYEGTRSARFQVGHKQEREIIWRDLKPSNETDVPAGSEGNEAEEISRQDTLKHVMAG